MSTGADGNEGIVELPEKVTSQDVGVNGNKSNTIPKGHGNAGVNPNDHMTSSKNQKSKVPENKQQGGNTEPTNTPSQDESPSLEPINETTTIDDIPHAEFHPAWISGTFYTADTHTDYFMDEATQHADPQLKGIAGETTQDVSEIARISRENVRHVGSEIHGLVVKKILNSDSEIGGILEDTVQSTDSEIGGILEDTVQSTDSEIGGILEDTVQSTDSEIGGILENTVQSTDSEIGGILEDTVQSTDSEIGGILEDTVQSTDSEIGGILEDTVQSTDSEIGGILEDTVQSTDSEFGGILEDTVQSTVSEIGGILEDTVQSTDSEIGGILEDTVQSTDSEIGGILEDTVQSTVSEIGGILENTVQSTDSEFGTSGTSGDASGVTEQPVPLCEAELSNKNVSKASNNNAISDIQTDSDANLAEINVTQMSAPLTVNEKMVTEPESRLSEELVADMTVDQATENNPDVGLLISSFPHAPVRIPSTTGEGIDSALKRTTSRSDAKFFELWVDASDEWGRPPASCLTPSDNTRTSKPEAESALLEVPTVASWSSSDSWASALSDWFQSVSVLPEDSNTGSIPASQHRFLMREEEEEEEEEENTGLESGDWDVEGIRPTVDLSVYTTADMSRTQDRKGEPAGQKEEDEEEENDCTERRLENECVSKESDALWEVSEEPAFEEGERNHGGLSVSCYPVAPQSGVHLLRDHLTGTAGGSSQRETDFIMPLTPITIGTSFLHLKEDPDERTRTSLKPSIAAISEDIRRDLTRSSICGKSTSESSDDQGSGTYKTASGDVSWELQRLIYPTAEPLTICEEKRLVYVTLDADDVLSFKKQNDLDCKMPRKSPKTSENKPRSNKHKDKTSNNQQQKRENVRPEDGAEEPGGAEENTATVIETAGMTDKTASRSQGKKKKKHGAAKLENEPLLEVENGTKPKNSKPKNETATKPPSKTRERGGKNEGKKETEENEKTSDAKTKPTTETLSVCPPCTLDDDIIKRRRISGDKPGGVTVRTRPQLPAIFQQRKKDDAVPQTSQTPKEVPRVISETEAAPVVDDPQSISLWCRFSHMTSDFSVTWVKDGATLREEKRKAGDDARVSLSLLKACRKDLGFYRCSLISASGSVSTSDYHLTSEVLMELVIPNHDTPAEREAVDGQEEDVSCAPLLFKDDILSDQYFGEQQHTSIVAEKDHFGEGMHRKAFRAMLRRGMTPLFDAGHACVLKVHSSIGYGPQNNDEVVRKNYNLAVEECYVQNTAREYIKAYTDVAKTAESFGDVPEIIPIVLVHRPSSPIPYATLEEELIGDFVKYSVKDGKEINLMRKDSEAGQKCCAFQHWVYAQTDGNLLVTDMQGVGMKLTDVGIATGKKGYKGFKGNCSTSFIEQFKALHQCNRFCELLGLSSLQPKPKRTAPPPNPKAQPAARKKTLGPNVKGKS